MSSPCTIPDTDPDALQDVLRRWAAPCLAEDAAGLQTRCVVRHPARFRRRFPSTEACALDLTDYVEQQGFPAVAQAAASPLRILRQAFPPERPVACAHAAFARMPCTHSDFET